MGAPQAFRSLALSPQVLWRERIVTLPVSAAAHVAAIAAVLLVPLLGSQELPPPRAFDPDRPVLVAVPPPPLPPPAQKTARTGPAAGPSLPPVLDDRRLVVPREVPQEIPADSYLDGFDPPRGAVDGDRLLAAVGALLGERAAGLREPDAPIPVGELVKAPRKLKHVAPAYPEAARLAGLQGVVVIECTISPRGAVANLRVVRGLPLLEQAALEAVRQWVYTPTLLNGVPVPVVMVVTVEFALARRG